MYTVECEIHTALGETVIQTLKCRTRDELEKTITLLQRCGHKLLGYRKTVE